MSIEMLIKIYIKYCLENGLLPEYTDISDINNNNDIFFLIDIALIYYELHNIDKKNIPTYLEFTK